MSDDPQHVSRAYDVFIIFAGCDHDIAEHIYSGLEAENLRCLAHWKDGAFRGGQPVFHSILKCMEQSETTLLILTKDSFSASWVSLETILALENSVMRGELTLRLLLYNVTDSEVSFLKKGLLENIPEIIVNINKDDWQKKLVKKLKSPIQLPDILPVGCLAHGQVFSHFTGYLVYLLPALENILKQTEAYKQSPDRVSMKLCMLLPGSCDLPQTFDKSDEESGITIRQFETIQFKAQHADKIRTINPTVYSVKKGKEEYFFIGDLPNVLNAIFRIHKRGLAKVDLRFQIARFYYTMIELLNHSDNQECVNKVTLVLYNDSTENVADVVFKAVRQDVLCQQIQAASMSQPTDISTRTPQRLMSQHKFKKDVLIVTCDELKDCKYALDILNFLEENGKTVTHQRSHFLDLDVARWVIFMISKEALFSKDGLMLKCVSVLVDSIDNNMLRTLPVLIDVEPSEVPQMIKWVTLVRVGETNYLKQILQTVNGETIRVQDRLPCWDVVTGLAWGYVVNYLVLTLLGRTESNLAFVGRIQKLLKDKGVSCGCVKKLFLLVPYSCHAKESIPLEANKGFPDGQGPIKYIGFLEPVTINTGGVHKREFKFHMYQYTDPRSRQSTCFLCEYATPIKCLHEMATKYPFAGLHLEEMHKQCDDFVMNLFPAITGREAVKKKCGDISDLAQLIYYDDKEETLLSALKNQIKFDKIDPTALVKA